LSLSSKVKVEQRQYWYVTHHLMVMHLHAKYHKPIWKNKKSLGQIRFGPDARTDGQSAIINNHFRRQWWSIKMPRTRWVCYGKITNLTLRSNVTNNGTRHIVWRWSTYMPNMKSLSWTTKSYSPDTICYGCTEQFHLEVKVQGQKQWYATHRLEVVYLHAKYAKPVLNDKKVTARTRFATDARTDRLITIGHLMKFYLKSFEFSTNSPPFVVCQCMSVLLEKCINSWNSSVPAIF
jgi:hypothetical protein